MRRKIFAALAMLFAPIAVNAQDVDGDGFVTYLLPVNAPEPIPGARGTIWKTELWVHNGTDGDLTLGICRVLPCMIPVHAAGVTEQAFESETLSYATPVLFHLPEGVAGNVTLSSRLFELSRQVQPAGVHIPVVREDRFFKGHSRFIGIPGNPSFRVSIRLFNPRPQSGNVASIQVFSTNGILIAERSITLSAASDGVPFAAIPGHTFIGDLVADFPALSDTERYDIRISPKTPDMEYWALVSVTDNETQQVTLVTAD